MADVFRKNITVTTIHIGTNRGEEDIQWFGKVNSNNVRGLVVKAVKARTGADTELTEVDNEILNGNFMVIDISDKTNTYECSYEKFFKIANPLF